jgi:hypothetical protein
MDATGESAVSAGEVTAIDFGTSSASDGNISPRLPPCRSDNSQELGAISFHFPRMVALRKSLRGT